jgi:hypothetical protein
VHFSGGLQCRFELEGRHMSTPPPLPPRLPSLQIDYFTSPRNPHRPVVHDSDDAFFWVAAGSLGIVMIVAMLWMCHN